MKKFLCLLLCLLLLIPIVSGCSSKTNSSSDVDEKTEEKENKKKKKKKNTDDSASTDDPLKPIEIVPDILTFASDDFNILCREDNDFGEYTYEITADEGATDIVSRAVYQRNRDICDMFGLSDINAITIPGNWANKDDFIYTFRNSIDAQLGEFDLIMGAQSYMTDASLIAYFHNFYDVPYVNGSLYKEYYNQSFIEEATINGQLKYMVSDYSLSQYNSAYVMLFNKTLAGNYSRENIYHLVNNGEWTMDKCIEMASGKWSDLNDDQWPGKEDLYGYISDTPGTLDALSTNFAAPIVQKVGNTYSLDADTAKITSILEKMIEFKKSDDTYFDYTTSDTTVSDNPLDKIFMEERALFYPTILGKAGLFRSMGVDFGIVPIPMWDTAQGGYYTTASSECSLACIPMDVENIEKSGAVYDTLSLLSYEYCVPALYDKALKDEWVRDEDSAQMLDIIRDSLTFNFGDIYNNYIGCNGMFHNLIRNDNSNFTSYFTANKKRYEKALYDFFALMNNPL